MRRKGERNSGQGDPSAPVEPDPLPKLADLHKSHYGLTKEVAHCYAQAADICFDRHHRPPLDLAIKTTGRSTLRRHRWRRPNKRAKAAWANKDDATRDGAYAVCIASVEVAEGLYAVGRTDTRTGADYFVSKEKAAAHLEDAYRLEVSGTDGGEIEATSRLSRKKQQTKEGTLDIPAFAAVVSFRDGVVLYAEAEN